MENETITYNMTCEPKAALKCEPVETIICKEGMFHSVYSHSVLYCCARSTRFEFWAVALAVKAVAALLRNDVQVNALSLSFSFVDLIVDLIAPMEELLCST